MPPLVAVASLLDAVRFAMSAALLVYCSIAVARRLGATRADRFWIAVAAAVTQLAAIAVVLSPTRSLTPIGFLFAQLAIAAAIAWTCGWAGDRGRVRFGSSLKPVAASPARRVLLLLIALFLLLGLWQTIVLPVHSFDDRMYRASRAAYWLQHRSVLPWTTHNDRQVAFPFGSELLFFWPVLFTRSEIPGRLAFFAGVPLCATGLYTVMRALRATRTAALAGVLVLLATPVFMHIQEGLFPEIWVTVFALGAAYFALRAASEPSRAAHHLAWLGFFLALAVNVKTTALALVPAAFVAPWLVTSPGARRRGMGGLVVGVVAGILLSGLAVTLAANMMRDGHPLGHPGLRAVHTADRSVRQLRTHAARFVVSLIDPPIVPTEAARRALSDTGNALLRLCGADAPLHGEGSPAPWPGSYAFGVGLYASRYALAGMLWLPALGVAALLAASVARGANRRRLAVLLLLALSMLSGCVLIIRWMGSVERFWVPAHALSLPILMLLLQHAARRWRWTPFVMAALLLATALLALWDGVQMVARRAPVSAMLLDEPFHSALREMPAGSRVVLVAAVDARDYGLFRPREGFANRVIPWGNRPFDAARMRLLIDEEVVTHVLVQGDVTLSMHWNTPLATAEMVRWLTEQPDLRELPARTPGMRLFGRAESTPAAATAATTHPLR